MQVGHVDLGDGIESLNVQHGHELLAQVCTFCDDSDENIHIDATTRTILMQIHAAYEGDVHKSLNVQQHHLCSLMHCALLE